MIAIIDYDAGNIRSVEKAVLRLGEEVVVTNNREEIIKADKVILPGVGSFGDAMGKLKRYDLIPTIKEVIENNTPFLGICLGLQLLFEESEEGSGVPGLGILKGSVKRFPHKEGFKVPHMGWNSLNFQNSGRLFEGIEEGAYVYFVHSYYLEAADEEIVKAKTEYSNTFDASIEKDNIFACQFHPEKSGDVGLLVLKNFMNLKGDE